MSNILKPLKYPSQTPTQIISIVLLKSVTGKPVWSTAPLSPTIIQRQNPLSTSFFQKPENQPFKPSFRPSWHEAFTPKEPAIIRTFSLLSKPFSAFYLNTSKTPLAYLINLPGSCRDCQLRIRDAFSVYFNGSLLYHPDCFRRAFNQPCIF